jgi:hypothetical protein
MTSPDVAEQSNSSFDINERTGQDLGQSIHFGDFEATDEVVSDQTEQKSEEEPQNPVKLESAPPDGPENDGNDEWPVSRSIHFDSVPAHEGNSDLYASESGDSQADAIASGESSILLISFIRPVM